MKTPKDTQLERKDEFRITESDLVKNKHPLNSWSAAYLFYGVPRKYNVAYRDIITGDIVFTLETK
jgi:hypothetical protein